LGEGETQGGKPWKGRCCWNWVKKTGGGLIHPGLGKKSREKYPKKGSTGMEEVLGGGGWVFLGVFGVALSCRKPFAQPVGWGPEKPSSKGCYPTGFWGEKRARQQKEFVKTAPTHQ